MKAFNTFNANSFISSPFNSPKGGKMGGLFPSQLENRELEQQRTAHFIRNTGQKISGSQISGLLAGRGKEEELRRDSSID